MAKIRGNKNLNAFGYGRSIDHNNAQNKVVPNASPTITSWTFRNSKRSTGYRLSSGIPSMSSMKNNWIRVMRNREPTIFQAEERNIFCSFSKSSETERNFSRIEFFTTDLPDFLCYTAADPKIEFSRRSFGSESAVRLNLRALHHKSANLVGVAPKCITDPSTSEVDFPAFHIW